MRKGWWNTQERSRVKKRWNISKWIEETVRIGDGMGRSSFESEKTLSLDTTCLDNEIIIFSKVRARY